MIFENLQQWLQWISSLNVKEVDLGLERVLFIAEKLNLLKPSCPVVTVAGTNGKGSCVAGLEAIYLAAGYKVGAFTSPFLFCYNEQIRVQGISVIDKVLCDAFAQIRAVSIDIRLTLFEYNTLAALLIFKLSKLDIWLLEVGLGGRWDAVNIIDADVAIITSIDIDHIEWLGNTREAIAKEKAGICRFNRPVVCGDFDPPNSLISYVKTIGSPLFCQEKQFGFEKKEHGWNWWCETKKLKNLPLPRLALQNIATVLMTVELLQTTLPLTPNIIYTVLEKIALPGRIQVINGKITQVFDVSHNPAAIGFLATYLKDHPIGGKTYAVFSMLADKDIIGSIHRIKQQIDYWFFAPLAVTRGASSENLMTCFQNATIETATLCSSIAQAFAAAVSVAKHGDRIISFGSFHTVAGTFHQLKNFALLH